MTPFNRNAFIEVREAMLIELPEQLDLLDELSYLVTDPLRHRERGWIVVGPKNSGKSRIITQFMERFPVTRERGVNRHPVVHLRMGKVSNTSQLVDELLRKLSPFNYKGNEKQRYQDLYALMQDLGVQLLLFDEFPDVLAGGAKTATQVLIRLKELFNDKCRIALFGTERMYKALENEPEFTTRLAQWTLHPLNRQQVGDIVVTLLKLGGIAVPGARAMVTITNKIFKRSGGYIGMVLDVVETAVTLSEREPQHGKRRCVAGEFSELKVDRALQRLKL